MEGDGTVSILTERVIPGTGSCPEKFTVPCLIGQVSKVQISKLNVGRSIQCPPTLYWIVKFMFPEVIVSSSWEEKFRVRIDRNKPRMEIKEGVFWTRET